MFVSSEDRAEVFVVISVEIIICILTGNKHQEYQNEIVFKHHTQDVLLTVIDDICRFIRCSSYAAFLAFIEVKISSCCPFRSRTVAFVTLYVQHR